MPVGVRLIIPTICAVFVTLLLTVLRPAGLSDFTLGAIVGLVLGISIVALVARRRRTF